MAVPTVTVNAATVEVLLRRLNLAVSPQSMVGWLNASVHPYLQSRATDRFRSEGDGASGKWEPLEDSTISFRESGGFPPTPINRRTGELEAYITGSPSRTDTSGAGATLTYPGVAPGGWLHEKVKTAQSGKRSPRTPARPVLALDPSVDVAWLLTSLRGWVTAYVAGSTPRGGPRR